MCRETAQSYGRYAEAHKKDELEDRLYRGTASLPEQVKACWELHGKGREWPQDRGYQVNIPARMMSRAVGRAPFDPVPRCEEFRTFTFHREVTRSKDFTTTRTHCMGITVEETYS
jgi:hypothetical protein